MAVTEPGTEAPMAPAEDAMARLRAVLPSRKRTAMARSLSPAPAAGRMQPLVTLIEIALALAIVAIAVSAFWSLFGGTPVPVATPAPAAAEAVVGPVANPFKTTDAEIVEEAPTATPAAVDTSLSLVLNGIWAEGEGRGSAIIQADGAPQELFEVGEDICCGAKLEEVHSDHVIISRAGAREALRLPNKSSASETVQPISAPGSVSAPQAASVVTFQPISSADGTFVLQLFPANDAQQFAALGFRPGDKLVRINGNDAPPDVSQAIELIATTAPGGVVNLVIERDGVEMPLDLSVEAIMGTIGAN